MVMDAINGIFDADSVDITLSKATPLISQGFVPCVFGRAF